MFEYLVNLNIVIVTTMNNEDPKLLTELYIGDHGENSPNWANSFIVPANDSRILPKRARAYKWVQALCGLHFQPPPGQVEDQQPLQVSLTDTIELLKRRTKTKFAFQAVSSELTAGTIKCSPSITQPVLNVPQSVSLRKWTEPSPQQRQIIAQDIEAAFDKQLSIDTNATYFHATFGTSAHPIIAQTLVQMPANYPWAAPTLYIIGSTHIPENEMTLIRESSALLSQLEVPAEQPERLVCHYLAWLRDCLNIYLDIEKRRDKSAFYEQQDRYRF